MIIVVEGISAAGKTTWCRSNASQYLVPETFPADRKTQPEKGLATAQYWTDWNAKRWNDALAMERTKGHGVCDTDPLKLHYSWCLLQIGLTEQSQWELQLQTTRQAVLERKLGFADAYFVKIIDPVIAKRQSDADTSRVRGRFDLHVRLQPALFLWYKHLDDVLSGRVHWELPESASHFDAIAPNDLRYDVEAFDAFIASLDK
jgi:hypothetical protein